MIWKSWGHVVSGDLGGETVRRRNGARMREQVRVVVPVALGRGRRGKRKLERRRRSNEEEKKKKLRGGEEESRWRRGRRRRGTSRKF